MNISFALSIRGEAIARKPIIPSLFSRASTQLWKLKNYITPVTFCKPALNMFYGECFFLGGKIKIKH
jgi:hypothetical protein